MKRLIALGIVIGCIVLGTCAFAVDLREFTIPLNAEEIPNMPETPAEIERELTVQDGHMVFTFGDEVDARWQLYVMNDYDWSWQQYSFDEGYGGFISQRSNYTQADADAFYGYLELSRIRTKEGSGLDEKHYIEYQSGGYVYTEITLDDEKEFFWRWMNGSFVEYGYSGILCCNYNNKEKTLRSYTYVPEGENGYHDFNVSVTYYPDGELSGAKLRFDIDENSYYVYERYSAFEYWWHYTDGVGSICEAPAAYNDYDEAKIQKLYPPLMGSSRTLPSFYDATLPQELHALEDSALAGTPIRRLYIPDGVTTLDSQVLLGCTELEFIRIPGSVNAISATAFDGCGDFTIVAPLGSCAASYAADMGIDYVPE